MYIEDKKITALKKSSLNLFKRFSLIVCFFVLFLPREFWLCRWCNCGQVVRLQDLQLKGCVFEFSQADRRFHNYENKYCRLVTEPQFIDLCNS